MRLLLDTHILLWAAYAPGRLSNTARIVLEDADNTLAFSVVSVWEVATKRRLRREDFRVDPRLLRRGLVDNSDEELALLGQHVAAVEGLPALHRDPVDRILVAQAMVEGITLLTMDPMVARYPGPIRAV